MLCCSWVFGAESSHPMLFFPWGPRGLGRSLYLRSRKFGVLPFRGDCGKSLHRNWRLLHPFDVFTVKELSILLSLNPIVLEIHALLRIDLSKWLWRGIFSLPIVAMQVLSNSLLLILRLKNLCSRSKYLRALTLPSFLSICNFCSTVSWGIKHRTAGMMSHQIITTEITNKPS